MSHHQFNFDMAARVKPGCKPREPLVEYAELAGRLDILPGQLRNALRDGEAPQPVPRLTSGKKRFYAMSDVQVWWLAIGGREFAVSKRAVYHQDWTADHARVQALQAA